MENKQKNVKISEKHHEMLKVHCEKNGLKIYNVLDSGRIDMAKQMLEKFMYEIQPPPEDYKPEAA